MIENALIILSIVVINFASFQIGEIHGTNDEKTPIPKMVSVVITVILSAVLFAWAYIVD